MIAPDRLDFAKGGGLVTVVAQDDETGAVLMVAHADREAIERTLESGELHLFSRARPVEEGGDERQRAPRALARRRLRRRRRARARASGRSGVPHREPVVLR
jgi:phosphoribosyl-ATP pyrophosphohydrolase/phosphoribosyl-AMP cyclohydrolase